MGLSVPLYFRLHVLVIWEHTEQAKERLTIFVLFSSLWCILVIRFYGEIQEKLDLYLENIVVKSYQSRVITVSISFPIFVSNMVIHALIFNSPQVHVKIDAMKKYVQLPIVLHRQKNVSLMAIIWQLPTLAGSCLTACAFA